ncbi:MAG: CRISPR-associated endonuclease Cas1 2 [Candidatus Syntrophoarchaeum sp. GoM_oil]|nr:MAG: CRISPR-associated endonuclease Cas1 2 [Candidatus Syntrophoarchaeum sp. GoM_oil]
MREFLLINGYGCSLKIKQNALIIQTGGLGKNTKNEHLEIPVYDVDFERVIINGKSGVITFAAIKWLMTERVSIVFLTWNGEILTQMNPEISHSSNIRKNQYSLSESQKLDLSKDLVASKINNTLSLVEWIEHTNLNSKQTTLNPIISKMEKNKQKIPKLEKRTELLAVEAAVSRLYWGLQKEIIPDKWGFRGRTNRRRGYTKPNNAKDHINCLLNYGYSLLESEVRRGVSMSGFDPYFGFYHIHQSGKVSFVYDLMESYRCLIEKMILENIKDLKPSFLFKKIIL